MACFHPIQAFQYGKGTRLVFRPDPFGVPPDLAIRMYGIKVPCNKCVGCRIEYSKQWAIRCVHEASLHDDNSFVTLTYAPEHLPADGSVCLRHTQLFLKSLRKYLSPQLIRFLNVAEYGERLLRPHYHMLLFGYWPPDAKLFARKKSGNLYTSEILSKIWGKGFVSFGEVTPESAGYCARYSLKKVNGPLADAHYERIDEETGEITILKKEFMTMSRRPGIAAGWFDKYYDEVYAADSVIVNGIPMKPPKFYDTLFDRMSPDAMDQIREDRLSAMQLYLDDYTPDRLIVRETCLKSRLSEKHRIYENGSV